MVATHQISYTDLTKEEVLKRVEEIMPLVKERALKIEADRKPDDDAASVVTP